MVMIQMQKQIPLLNYNIHDTCSQGDLLYDDWRFSK